MARPGLDARDFRHWVPEPAGGTGVDPHGPSVPNAAVGHAEPLVGLRDSRARAQAAYASVRWLPAG